MTDRCVPVPRFDSLVEKNKELLSECDEDMQREHYDKNRLISDLFQEDKAALLPLPSIRFDTAGYGTATTDKYGRLKLSILVDTFCSRIRSKYASADQLAIWNC